MRKQSKEIIRPETALIYVRVSSGEQVSNYSLGNQEKGCREYAQKNGWTVLKLFREEGESAKIADRTQMNLMKEYVQQHPGKVGYIIVWKADRFSRNSTDHALLRKFFQDRGALLRSATEMIDETPYGRFFELLLSGVANLDNDMRSEKSILGMKSKAQDGYWPTVAPWGYMNTEDAAKQKIIVPHPDRAPIVKFIFEEFARGAIRYKDLAHKVNKMSDVRTRHGCKVSKQLVYKTLRNPIHCGRIEIPRFGIVAKGKHQSIISEALFEEVQIIMDGGRVRKMPRHRDNPDFPLRGLKCKCGRNFSGGFSTGRNQKYAYYKCMWKDCPDQKSIPKLDFENDFTNFLERITPELIILEALKESLVVAYEKDRSSSIEQARKLETALKKIEVQMDSLLSIKIKGLIDDDSFLNMNEKLKAEKRELEAHQRELENPKIEVKEAVEFGIRIVQEFPAIWGILEPGELRVLRSLFFPQNLVFQYGGFKTAKLAPIYNLKEVETDQLDHLGCRRRGR